MEAAARVSRQDACSKAYLLQANARNDVFYALLFKLQEPRALTRMPYVNRAAIP